MSRRFKPKKKQSKLDEALANSRQNKKKLSASIQINEATQAVTTTFNATPIVTYAEPAGTGFRTKLTSVQVKGSIMKDLTPLIQVPYRIDLVLDREPKNDITPLILYGSATPTIGAFKQNAYKRRFKILRTHSGVFGLSGEGVTGHIIDWYVKLNLMTETKDENSFTAVNVIKNSIYLIYWCIGAQDQPTTALQFRLNNMESA